MPEKENQFKTHTFTLRLTQEQRDRLEHKAGKRPLGEYMRNKALEEDSPTVQARNLYPIKDQNAANQILGELGRSRFSEDLHELARAAKKGTLILTPKESSVLLAACADIARMLRLLMRALGFRKLDDDY